MNIDVIVDGKKQKTADEKNSSVIPTDPIWENGKTLGLTDNCVRVLMSRYLKKGPDGKCTETPHELFSRVAKTVAGAEAKYGATLEQIDQAEKEYYDIMVKGIYMPNSPTLMNAGREMGMLSACFVLPVGDSIDEIFDTVKATALIQKAGGGTGFSFDRLRPTGDWIKSSGGTTSGPISFWKVLSETTNAIQQGAFRRGANMGMMRCDHPDILKFIFAKQDLSHFQNYNISVKVPDAWMKAYRENPTGPNVVVNFRNNKAYVLPKSLKIESYQINELISLEKYNAMTSDKRPAVWTMAEIWDTIVQNAWQTGEPGVAFIDRINQFNPTPNVGEMEATNPCLTKDNWILTSKGPKLVADLVGHSFEAIVDGRTWDSAASGFFSTGVKEVVKLRTVEGYSIRLTSNHLVNKVVKKTRYAIKSEWTKAGNLVPGDSIVLHNHRSLNGWKGTYTEEQGYLLGFLLGDGTLKEECAVLCAWQAESTNDPLLVEAERCMRTLKHRADFSGWRSIPGRNEHRMSLAALRDLAAEFDMHAGKKIFTQKIEQTSSDFHVGFIRGIFDADASVQGDYEKGVSIRLGQSNLNTLEGVQRMLLRLGINSAIFPRRDAGTAILPNGKGGSGEYPTLAQYELIISNDNMKIYADKIGFADSEKEEKLSALISGYSRTMNRERFIAKIERIDKDGSEEVFDVQIPGINVFDANGIFTHNCGEQPLLPFEACNLGSINLGYFVSQDGKAVDWDGMRKAVHTSTRFLENVVEVNNYVIPQIHKVCTENRKIGLGIMGFADALFKLGVGYNTPEGVEWGEKFMKFVNDEAHNESERLADERGAFKNWKGSRWETEWKRKQRNACSTTVAPTGTISILANCSGGVEPLFSLAFFRQVMRDHTGKAQQMAEVNEHFKAVAKANNFWGYGEQELFDRLATEGTLHNIPNIPEEVKRTFVSAHDISPEWHVRMQAAFQKHCDSSISKTTNFPNNATPEDVRHIYDLAFDTGCKGVTVYRDGCRKGQPMTLKSGKDKEEEKKDFSRNGDHAAPTGRLTPKVKTPTILSAVRIRSNTPFGHMHLTISVDPRSEHELEVFAQLGKAGDVAASDLEAICRMVSLFLRCGGTLDHVIDQLEGIGCHLAIPTKDGRVMSLGDAVGKSLKKYWHAKRKYGLKSILLGEIDIDAAEMPHLNGHSIAVKPRTKQLVAEELVNNYKLKCQECGNGTLAFVEGCMKCAACGYSKC